MVLVGAVALLVVLLIGRIGRLMVPMGVAVGVMVVVRKSDSGSGCRHWAGYEPSGRGLDR